MTSLWDFSSYKLSMARGHGGIYLDNKEYSIIKKNMIYHEEKRSL